jgi:hypothetical protein
MGIYVTIICDIVKLTAMLFGLISAPMMRRLRQPSSYAPEGSRLLQRFIDWQRVLRVFPDYKRNSGGRKSAILAADTKYPAKPSGLIVKRLFAPR